MSKPHEHRNLTQEKLDKMTPDQMGTFAIQRTLSDSGFWREYKNVVKDPQKLPKASEKFPSAMLATEEMHHAADYMDQEISTDKYLAETGEGQQIVAAIQGLETVTKWVRNSDPSRGGVFAHDDGGAKEQLKGQAIGFMEANNMDAEGLAASVRELNRRDASAVHEINEPFEKSIVSLRDIARSLATDPRYEFENVVKFDPFGTGEHLERGTYMGVSPMGDLLVAGEDGQPLHVLLEQLDAWNGHETPVLVKQ